MVVMAGGFGKRMRPYTLDKPKPLLEVGGGNLFLLISSSAPSNRVLSKYIFQSTTLLIRSNRILETEVNSGFQFPTYMKISR